MFPQPLFVARTLEVQLFAPLTHAETQVSCSIPYLMPESKSKYHALRELGPAIRDRATAFAAAVSRDSPGPAILATSRRSSRTPVPMNRTRSPHMASAQSNEQA